MMILLTWERNVVSGRVKICQICPRVRFSQICRIFSDLSDPLYVRRGFIFCDTGTRVPLQLVGQGPVICHPLMRAATLSSLEGLCSSFCKLPSFE